MINLNQKNERIQELIEAIKSGDETGIRTAAEAFHSSIYEGIKADFAEYQALADKKVLAGRGYRQLTSDEEKFYQKVIDAIKSGKNARQALLTSVPDGAMPTTIIQDIYKEIKKEHPLLSSVSFRYVGYLTKWILADHTAQKAKWGKVTDEIVQEITSGLKEVDVTQNKLSAYVFIQNGLIDMGATFLDAYIREILKESIALGLENGIISGTGVNSPIGMDRDIHEGVSFNTSTGYPQKKAESLANFLPENYGKLLAKLAKTEKGNPRTFEKVILITNMSDFLTKVMPSSTVLNANGTYTGQVFPFPTETCISSEIPEGKAIIGLPQEYSLLAGGSEDGVIEVSEEYKFVEDMTTFKIKQYAAGRAYDNTCFLLVDISKLEPLYILVKDLNNVATAASTQATQTNDEK